VVSGHLLSFALEEAGHPAPIACLDKPEGLLKRVSMPFLDFDPILANRMISVITIDPAEEAEGVSLA